MAALAGKVALVTGGGSGLGRAVVRRFLQEEAAVVVLERSEAAARELETELPAGAGHVVTGDVRSADDNRRAVDEALAQYGSLDVFVGNAGVYDNRASLAEMSPDGLDAAFDEIFSTNVKGYLLGVRTALDALRASRGCVVLTASVSSHTAGYGGVLYVASKHAVAGVVRQLAWELAPEVRVNGVAPGFVPTGLTGLASLGQGKPVSAPEAKDLPLQAIQEADDYAGLYVLLASEAGRVATGTLITADGGLSVAGPAFKGWSK